MTRSLIVGILLAGSPAWAAEYRAITLSNGRVVPAEIQGITSTAMTLTTPQGVMEIPPEDLRAMDAMSEDDYNAVKPWTVLVLPFANDESVGAQDDARTAQLYALRVLKSIPAISPITIDALPPSVPENTRRALSLCRTDLQCATRHGATVGADVVIMGDLRETASGKTFSLGAVFVDSPSARMREEIHYSPPLINHRAALTAAQYDVLFLQQPTTQAIVNTPIITQEAESSSTESNLLTTADSTKTPNLDRLAWAPVPGITALQSGNTTGFAAALGAVGVGTAASVYVAGHATYSAPQLVAVSALSTYGLTVLVNHIFLKP
jgi:hypothetical protein